MSARDLATPSHPEPHPQALADAADLSDIDFPDDVELTSERVSKRFRPGPRGRGEVRHFLEQCLEEDEERAQEESVFQEGPGRTAEDLRTEQDLIISDGIRLSSARIMTNLTKRSMTPTTPGTFNRGRKSRPYSMDVSIPSLAPHDVAYPTPEPDTPSFLPPFVNKNGASRKSKRLDVCNRGAEGRGREERRVPQALATSKACAQFPDVDSASGEEHVRSRAVPGSSARDAQLGPLTPIPGTLASPELGESARLPFSKPQSLTKPSSATAIPRAPQTPLLPTPLPVPASLSVSKITDHNQPKLDFENLWISKREKAVEHERKKKTEEALIGSGLAKASEMKAWASTGVSRMSTAGSETPIVGQGLGLGASATTVMGTVECESDSSSRSNTSSSSRLASVWNSLQPLNPKTWTASLRSRTSSQSGRAPSLASIMAPVTSSPSTSGASSPPLGSQPRHLPSPTPYHNTSISSATSNSTTNNSLSSHHRYHQHHPRRTPVLIKNLNSTKNRKTVGSMTYDPALKRWNGNDADLDAFSDLEWEDQKLQRLKKPAPVGEDLVRDSERFSFKEGAEDDDSASTMTVTSTNTVVDRLSANLTEGLKVLPKDGPPCATKKNFSRALTHTVGAMTFDPVRMCWVGNEEEEDVFEGIDDSEDENHSLGKGDDVTEECAGATGVRGISDMEAHRSGHAAVGETLSIPRRNSQRLHFPSSPSSSSSLSSSLNPGTLTLEQQTQPTRVQPLKDPAHAPAQVRFLMTSSKSTSDIISSPSPFNDPISSATACSSSSSLDEFTLSPSQILEMTLSEHAHNTYMSKWHRPSAPASSNSGRAISGSHPGKKKWYLPGWAATVPMCGRDRHRRRRSHLHDIRVIAMGTRMCEWTEVWRELQGKSKARTGSGKTNNAATAVGARDRS